MNEVIYGIFAEDLEQREIQWLARIEAAFRAWTMYEALEYYDLMYRNPVHEQKELYAQFLVNERGMSEREAFTAAGDYHERPLFNEALKLIAEKVKLEDRPMFNEAL
jgi:hypothetical protein